MLQNIVMPSALVAAAEIVAGAALYYIFTISVPLGLNGAAIALNLAEVFGMVAIIVWSIVLIKRSPPGDKTSESWQGFSLEAFQVTHCQQLCVYHSSLHGTNHHTVLHVAIRWAYMLNILQHTDPVHDCGGLEHDSGLERYNSYVEEIRL